MASMPPATASETGEHEGAHIVVPTKYCGFDFSVSLISNISKHLKNGKAFGGDSIPPELYETFHELLAKIVSPLYRNAFSNVPALSSLREG